MSAPSPWKHILVATDFSECSRGAVDLAKRMLRDDAVQLTVLSAVEPATHGLRIQTDDIHDKMKGEARAAIDKLLAEEFQGDSRVNGVIASDSAADAICEEASKRGVDLVIVGSHGAKGMKRYLLGSVAEKVVRHAPCHVLVAR